MQSPRGCVRHAILTKNFSREPADGAVVQASVNWPLVPAIAAEQHVWNPRRVMFGVD